MEFDIGLDKHHLERLGQTAPLTGIIELIWNALDADAEDIKVELVRNGLDGIEEIRVADDGHGIRPEDAERAFGLLAGRGNAAMRAHRPRTAHCMAATVGDDFERPESAAGSGGEPSRWQATNLNAIS